MINIPISNRRWLSWTMTPALVFMLAQMVFIVGRETWKSPLTGSLLSLQPLAHLQTSKKSLPAAGPAFQQRVLPKIDPNQFKFNTVFRDYHHTVVGTVTCGGHPCQAQVQLFLESELNPNWRKTIGTDPNGRFELEFDLKEKTGRNVDWRMLITSPSTSYPVELTGRQILTENSNILVERTIALP